MNRFLQTVPVLIIALCSFLSAQVPQFDSSLSRDSSAYSKNDSAAAVPVDSMSTNADVDTIDSVSTIDTSSTVFVDTVINSSSIELSEDFSDSVVIVIEGVLIDKETGGVPVDDSMAIYIDSAKVLADSSGEFSLSVGLQQYYLVSVASKKFQPIQNTVTFIEGKKNYFLTFQLDRKTDTSSTIVKKRADTASIPWTISGTIIDSRFDLAIESDSTVLLFDMDTVRVTENVNFVVTTKISGDHTFYVTIPGYQPVTWPITLVEEEKQLFITIPTTIPGKTIARREITVSAKRLPVHRSAEISKVDIPRIELQHTAATLNDPIRVLQTLPGVASEADVSARPVVRGGDVNEARVFLDGVPLLLPYHYGGVRSTFNQQALGHLTLYKTGFPAEMHNAQSALIEAYSRIPSDEKFSIEFDLNPLQYSLYVGAPLFDGKAGLNFSSQGSFYEQIFKLITKVGEKAGNQTMGDAIKQVNIPDYKDFSTGISISPSPQFKIFINESYNSDNLKFTYGDSVVDVTYNYYTYDSQNNWVLDTSVTLEEDYYGWGFQDFSYSVPIREPIYGRLYVGNPVVGKPRFDIDTLIDYHSIFNVLYGKIQYIQSDNSIINTTVAWQKRRWDLNFPDYDLDIFGAAVYDIDINQFNFNAGWIYSGFNNHLLKSGVQLDYTKAAYDVFIARLLHRIISSGSTNFSDFWGAVNGDTARVIDTDDEDIMITIMDRILVAYKGTTNFVNAAFYCSDGWDISNRLHSDIGLRVEYSQADHVKLISPRLSVKYNLTEKNELLLSTGHYTQNNYEIGVMALSEELKPEKVWHGAFGVESKLLPWLTQKVDVYGKYYYDLASEIIDVSVTPIDEMIEKYLEENYRYNMNYLDTLSTESYQRIWMKAIYDLNRYTTRYTSDGRGYSYGFEYMLRYDPTDFWHGWLSLSWGQSVRERRKGWRKHPFPLDRPLLLSVNNYYRLPRKYEISLKYRYMSGLPYTSVNDKNDQITIGDFNDSRYDAYHRLDMRFSKGFSVRSAKGNFYTEIWSAMNSPNVYGVDSKTKELITILPNFPVTMLFVGVECTF